MTGHAVLIVEDDETLLRGLSDHFRSQGYRVTTATDGRLAVEAAERGEPDLILLDLMLPSVSGYEVCRAIRRRDSETPIIMLTAKGREEDVVRGLELGADDYVTKPFGIFELSARVRAFLRRRKAVVEPVHCFGRFRLDSTAHKLFRDDAEVVLTAKEFRLLAYFASRSGRAVTRNELLNAVWGRSVIVTARSVDRCVTTLRGKIEADTRRPRHIITIRDVGYRFEPCDEEA